MPTASVYATAQEARDNLEAYADERRASWLDYRVVWRQETGDYVIREEPRYKIVRRYFRGGSRTIRTGLTLSEARAHCSDPETSSSTCKKAKGRATTRRVGPWFDSYTQH